jgi:hypothetical protein
MTVNTTTSRADYLGDGTSTAFAVPFVFFATSELRVIERVIATGVETTLVQGTQYTVSGGNGSTGTVTATAAPTAAVQWTILRNTARTQLTDYSANDAFPAETHERALDRLTAIAQEVERDQAQAVRVAPTDPVSLILPAGPARAGRFLGFDSAGNPIASALTVSGVITATAFATTLLDDADAAAARDTLEITRTTTVISAGATQVLIDIPATWRAARLILVGLRGTVAAAQLLAQMRRVGQGAEDSGGSSYLSAFIGRSNATAGNAVSSGNVTAASIGLTLGIDSVASPSGMVEALLDTALGGGFAQIVGTARGFDATNFDHILTTAGRLGIAGQINRVRLFWNSGNFNAGTLVVERVA